MESIPKDTVGFWGPRTASEDWCEPNYLHTWYIAEFYNFWSSVPIFLLGAFGVKLAMQQRWKQKLLWPLIGLMIVGLGSMGFHGTLLKGGQALDELSMIWSAAFLVYAALQAEARHAPHWLGRALGMYLLSFSLAYFYIPGFFIYFILSYMGLCGVIFYRSAMLHRQLQGRSAKILLQLSMILYPAGFIFMWLPDKLACAAVQQYSLHAWFHLLSGMAGWCSIMFVVHSHYELARQAAELTASHSGGAARGGAAASAHVVITVLPVPTVLYHASLLPYVSLRQKGA